MNENPIAAAHASDQYEHAAPEVVPDQGVSDKPAKPMDAPDSKEAHEYRSDWNQDEDKGKDE